MSDNGVPMPPVPAIDRGVGVLDEEPADDGLVPVGAAEADRLYGDDAPYDRDRLTAEVRHHLGQGVLAMLEAGRRLIVLKEHEEHGAWLPLLERIGISHNVAKSVMRAARKFLDGPNRELVTHLGSATKVYELALMDDDDLDELREGNSVAGVDLDDIARMSPSELRATLRKERRDRRESAEAQRQRIGRKDAEIEELRAAAEVRRRELARLRIPGSVSWSDDEVALYIAAAQISRQARDLTQNLEAALRQVSELDQRPYDERIRHPGGADRVIPLLESAVAHIGSQLQGLEDLVPPIVTGEQAADE